MAPMNDKRPLRSQAWFDNPANADMTALYLERYLNYGLSQEELQSGRPIIGIAQTGSDLSPCNRHHLELAKRVREGIREAGGIAIEFPVHPIQETGKRPTAALDRNLAYLGLVEVLYRLSAGRRGARHRLRQDHAGLPDGGGDGEHSRHRALGRADAERLVPRRAHRLRHHRLEGARTAGQGRDRLCRLRQAGGLLGALDRLLQHHGHGDDDELARRGAGHAVARLGGDSRALSRPAGNGLPHRAAHRRHGARGSEAVGHPDPRGVHQRHPRHLGDRRLDQCADPPQRARPPHGRRALHRRLADLWRGRAAAGEPAAGRRISRRGLLPCRRRARGGQPAHGPGPDRRGCAHRQWPQHRRELPLDRHPGRGGDPPVRSPAEGEGRLPRAARQSVLVRHHEDQRDLAGVPRTLPLQSRRPGGLRGPRHRVRWAGGLPQADRRPVARHRRDEHPVHARRRTDRLSRLRRGGEHAGAGLPHQGRHLLAALHRRWPPIRHLGLALDPQRLAGSGGRRRARCCCAPATACAST